MKTFLEYLTSLPKKMVAIPRSTFSMHLNTYLTETVVLAVSQLEDRSCFLLSFGGEQKYLTAFLDYDLASENNHVVTTIDEY